MKKLFSAVFFICIPFFINAKEIALYHTSDIHGYYFARADETGRLYGGFAALETLLQQERRPFMLLDSGDWSSGNKEANDSDGKTSLLLMNNAGKSKYNFKKKGYAALTIGNHDSDFGDARLADTLKLLKGDLLAINIDNFAAPTKEFEIYNVGGVKVALAGIALDGPGMTGIKMKPVNPEVISALIAKIKAPNPDVIVLISHDSIGDPRKPSAYSQAFTQNLKDIDLVLGGHAHVLVNKRGLGEEGPLFVESGFFLGGVSKIVLDVDDKTNKVKSIDAQYIPLDLSAYPEDKKVKKTLDKIEDKSLRETAAYAEALIPKYPAPGDASPPAAKLIADFMYPWLNQRERVDLTTFTLPTIRRDILPGAQTGRDLVEILPYAEYFSTVDISGAHLKHVIKESLKRDAKGDYCMHSFSDNVRIVYTYDDKKKEGSVCSFKIDGREVQDGQIYRLGILPHLPEGYFEGAPFKTYKGAVNYNKKVYNGTNGLEKKDCAGAFLEVVKNNKNILAEPGDRINDPRIKLVAACP